MNLALSCLIFADHMNIHSLIQNHVKFEIWIFSWFIMIMGILGHHSLILVNKNPTPASQGSPRMQVHLDEKSGQGEELGVQAHPWCGCTTHGSIVPQFLHTWSWCCVSPISDGMVVCRCCFLHGRCPSSYINHPKPLPLFTPSTKLPLSFSKAL